MATQPISMNIIKQVLIRLSQKESIRSIAATLHININKNTVSRYKSLAEADPMSVRELLALEDTVLNHRFNGGNPAYCDEVIDFFNDEFDYRSVANHKELTDMAVALFIGLLETPSVSVGGGEGSQSELPWRDKNDDDLQWARRCARAAEYAR